MDTAIEIGYTGGQCVCELVGGGSVALLIARCRPTSLLDRFDAPFDAYKARVVRADFGVTASG